MEEGKLWETFWQPEKLSWVCHFQQKPQVFSDMAGAKGLGLYIPTLFSDWVQAALGSGCELGQSDSLQPEVPEGTII